MFLYVASGSGELLITRKERNSRGGSPAATQSAPKPTHAVDGKTPALPIYVYDATISPGIQIHGGLTSSTVVEGCFMM